MPTASKPKRYNPRQPERTLLYQTVAEHYKTWLDLASTAQFDGQGDHHMPKPYVRQAFDKYLEFDIFAHGFSRARCGDCGHDFLVAFSCKGRSVCPSCTTWRMAETAAQLIDHVFPRLPVLQWVLLVSKRLRYFIQRDGEMLNRVLRIFLLVIAQTLLANSPGAANVDTAILHVGAVAFIHRFGSSLNEHVHFHVCPVDGVFEQVTGEGDVDAHAPAHAPRVIFHNAVGLGTTQLYNQTLVYNYKRDGVFRLGNRQLDFRVKPRFPEKLSREFLCVDLLKNLDELAENRDALLSEARRQLDSFDLCRLQDAAASYGNMATRKWLLEWTHG